MGFFPSPGFSFTLIFLKRSVHGQSAFCSRSADEPSGWPQSTNTPRGTLTGRCSESQVENHLQVLPPTSGLPPGGGTHFCFQILIQPHLPGYHSPGGAGISLWIAGEKTTGVFHGDDTFANAWPGRRRAHLLKLEQGFPLPPLGQPCGRWACRSGLRKDSSSLRNTWSLGFGCV